MIIEHRFLDARGLSCPLLLLKAKKALCDLDPGQILKIIATDPAAPRNFEVYAKQSKNRLLEPVWTGAEFICYIEKS